MDENTRLIELFQGRDKRPSGIFTLVDAEDYEWLMQWQWRLSTWGYAVRKDGLRTVFMHREIMKAPPRMDVDHRFHNTLDNRKSELRVCPHRKNRWNHKGVQDRSTVGFMGVKRCRDRFHARITANKTVYHLGAFPAAEDAARAYDSAAALLFGEFASYNFPGRVVAVKSLEEIRLRAAELRAASAFRP